MMMLRHAATGVIALAISAAGISHLQAQSGGESFTATASVVTAGGANATAPVTIVVSRKMTGDEAAKLTAVYARDGAAALRKALNGVPPAGSIRIAAGKPSPIRIALERATDKGRLLTLITDQPILHLGAGLPGAKAKEGYDFGVIDIEVDAAGRGAGTLMPAARIRVDKAVFVIDDYGGQSIQLTGVQKAK